MFPVSRGVHSVQITNEIARSASDLRDPSDSEETSFRRFRYSADWPDRNLPRSPDGLVRFGHLQETLVALGDGVDVGSYRGWLAGCWRQRHRVLVGTEFAGGRRRRLWRGHVDGQRAGLVHGVELVAEMRHQFGAEGDVDAGGSGQAAADLVRTMRVAGAKAVGVNHRIC